MSEMKQDPELLDDHDEGTGDDTAYVEGDVDYDHAFFELPDDYEEEDDEDE